MRTGSPARPFWTWQAQLRVATHALNSGALLCGLQRPLAVDGDQ